MITLRALVAAVMLFPAGAGAASPHDDAVAALRDGPTADARRRAAQELAESGVMADVPGLVRALRDADTVVRALAENALWRVWSRSGDADIDRLFALGVEQMSQRQLEEAVETFTRIIERRPEFAEGWNKRATVYFMQGELERSLADCDEVIKRNPYHFGVLSGYGMIYLQRDEPTRALSYFERALAVNPNLHSVEEAVEVLRRLLLQQRKNTI
ncbi:MAG TPA: tetratricopeptide repeat protein [Methylomirabilota bacterium]|jgi:tetratricopeptide (TPR) repeat protein